MRKAMFVLAVLALAAAPAAADPLNISNISGIWINNVGGEHLKGLGTSAVTWGDGVAPDSGYTFTAASDIYGAALATPLLLGTFTHHNEPIPSGSGIKAIDLRFGFDTNGIPSALSVTTTFLHDETPNTQPCDYYSTTPCADRVMIPNPILNSLITVGGDQQYYFNLIGFSTDGGATIIPSFISQEGGSNSAQLYGMVTAHQISVPDGGMTVALLGAALAGLGLIRRKLS